MVGPNDRNESACTGKPSDVNGIVAVEFTDNTGEILLVGVILKKLNAV